MVYKSPAVLQGQIFSNLLFSVIKREMLAIVILHDLLIIQAQTSRWQHILHACDRGLHFHPVALRVLHQQQQQQPKERRLENRSVLLSE